MTAPAMGVLAKNLRPGDVILLPSSTNGAAREEHAEVLSLERTIKREVGDAGILTEEDVTSIVVQVLPPHARTDLSKVHSAHVFLLTTKLR